MVSWRFMPKNNRFSPRIAKVGLDKYRIPTLEYAGKRSEAVILAQAAITGGAAPLQIVRSFANGKNGDWKNLIVQGDNLQFLKTC